nr:MULTISPECIES: hypothetical protein [Myxococcaceae]
MDAFFRSFGFESEADLAQLAAGVACAAGTAPLAQAQRQVEAWLAEALDLAAGSDAVLARGRAAFVLSGLPAHGAAVLLAPAAALSCTQLRALRAALPLPTPAEAPGAMPEQQLVLNPLVALLRRCWRASEPDLSVIR